jgi:hypothetical protein
MYKPGDQIITGKTFGKDTEIIIVGKIIKIADWWEGVQLYYCTEICGSTPSYDGSRKDSNHYIAFDDDNIKGLYEGKISCLDVSWEPKHGIGDSILVKLEYFEEHPTWHTILGLRLYRSGDDIRYGYLVSGGINQHGYMLFEDEILDVIRYGETR